MENCSNLEARVTKRNLIKDIILEELYIDLVPRCCKKRDVNLVNNLKRRKFVAMVDAWSSILKASVGMGTLLSLPVLDLKNYETLVTGIGLYLAIDGIYQIFNLASSLDYEGRRKAATWALDLITYPFYRLSSRYKADIK